MKIRSSVIALSVSATGLIFMNCGGDKHHHGAHSEKDAKESMTSEVSKPVHDVDQKFQEQLTAVFTSYVDLQEAFVSSDPSKVQKEASETTDALKNVDMTLLSGAAHNDWMVYVAPIESSLTEIAGSGDIEAQRKAFTTVSDNLYKSIKSFGLVGEDAYYTYCPMAFDNQGSHWLSDNDKIRNPYFGDKMLTCGHVKEKLASQSSN